VILYFHATNGNVSTASARCAVARAGLARAGRRLPGTARSDGRVPEGGTIYETRSGARRPSRSLAGQAARCLRLRDSLGAPSPRSAAKHPELGGLIVGKRLHLDLRHGAAGIEIRDLTRSAAAEPALRVDQEGSRSSRFRYSTSTARDRVVPYSMRRAFSSGPAGSSVFVAVPGGGHENNAAVRRRPLRAAITEAHAPKPDAGRAGGLHSAVASSPVMRRAARHTT